MGTGRLQAFSDGVIAIIITIMVLELQVPREATLAAFVKLAPVLLSYLLSYVVVAIMWVNHHHLIYLARRPEARLLWTNNVLLFWMSLIPFVTRYMGLNPKVPFAVALYGGVMTLSATAFTLLRHIVNLQLGRDREAAAYHRGKLWKSIYSTSLYAATVPLAYVSTSAAYAIFVLIPILYFIPERKLAAQAEEALDIPTGSTERD
ncbi:MAG TPA: TMEM175 family protein [Verrucomicrobiae bacterium]|jgi:uncharacterized membrane protein|nr:TMEM175 family protein [Verrucomicrobiae bacterium]